MLVFYFLLVICGIAFLYTFYKKPVFFLKIFLIAGVSIFLFWWGMDHFIPGPIPIRLPIAMGLFLGSFIAYFFTIGKVSDDHWKVIQAYENDLQKANTVVDLDLFIMRGRELKKSDANHSQYHARDINRIILLAMEKQNALLKQQ